MKNSIIIFGAGKLLKYHADKIDMQEVLCFADNNAGQDKLLFGKRIIKPERIKEYNYDYIVIFLDKDQIIVDIRKQLWELGVSDEKIINWTYYLFKIKHNGRKISNDACGEIKYIINELDIDKILDINSSLIASEFYIRDNNVFEEGKEYVDYMPRIKDSQKKYSRQIDNLDDVFDAAILIDLYIEKSAEEIKHIFEVIKDYCRYIIFTVPYLCPREYSDVNDLKWNFRKTRTIKLEYSELVVVDLYENEDNLDTSVYTIAHKEFNKPKDKMYIPIYVGEYFETETLRDNEGDNIAKWNSLINECTAIYWIWRNTESKYVGITHYRRYFVIGNFWLDKDDNLLDEWYVKKYLRKYDMITIRSANGFPNTIKDVLQYSISESAFNKAYNGIRKIIKKKYPDYLSDFDFYFNGYVVQTCNMMVCLKKIYDQYCEWLFDILIDACSTINLDGEDSQSIRAIGYMAERLLSLWISHNNILVKELPLLIR